MLDAVRKQLKEGKRNGSSAWGQIEVWHLHKLKAFKWYEWQSVGIRELELATSLIFSFLWKEKEKQKEKGEVGKTEGTGKTEGAGSGQLSEVLG